MIKISMDRIFVPVSYNIQMFILKYYLLVIPTFISEFII